MSVLKGEGTTVILYGSTSVSTGSRSHPGYLARPDLMGEWPTVVVVSPSYDAASSVGDICRLIARHAMAAVAPGPGGLSAFVKFIINPAGLWSNAEHGFGLLAFGDGSLTAVEHAASSPLVASLALVDPVIGDRAVALLGDVDVPILGTSGREVLDGVELAREAAPHAEWVVYDGVGAQFWNINADEYDVGAAEDTTDRVLEFLPGTLPPKI